VRAHGKTLAVDEAHGAHLAFAGARYPLSAMALGADMCVQSAHKTLPALTPGAYLHVRSPRLDLERLRFFLRLFQTSSPSYPVMESLDTARAYMAGCGAAALEALARDIEEAKRAPDLRGLRFLGAGEGFLADPSRIVLNLRGAGVSGYEAERLLRLKYNVVPEMADPNNVVCIATVSDSGDDIKRLFGAFRFLAASARADAVGAAPTVPAPNRVAFAHEPPPAAMRPSDAINAEGEAVPLRDARGRVSRDVISPYPPGIPALCPGEIITETAAKSLCVVAEAGGRINGLTRGKDGEAYVNVVRRQR